MNIAFRLAQLDSTFLIAGATLTGAFIGSVGTFLTRYYFEKRSQERRRNKLRQGLIAELESAIALEVITEEIDNLSPESNTNVLKTFNLNEVTPDTIYESNADKIGTLTEGEVSAVVEFYTYSEAIAKFQNFTAEAMKDNKELQDDAVTNKNEIVELKKEVMDIDTSFSDHHKSGEGEHQIMEDIDGLLESTKEMIDSTEHWMERNDLYIRIMVKELEIRRLEALQQLHENLQST